MTKNTALVPAIYDGREQAWIKHQLLESYLEKLLLIIGMAARSQGKVEICYPCRNVAESAKLYTVDPKQHLQADRDAEARGLEIIGVFHSHTHSDAYPSPTDVEQAPDPTWHYVIVSLRDSAPTLRSYRIADGTIDEEPVVLEGR